jgi:hypothetical protein
LLAAVRVEMTDRAAAARAVIEQRQVFQYYLA